MKPYTLTNREGESISPMTSTKTVFDANGTDIETRLDEQKQSIETRLGACAKKTEVAQGLAAKQDALSDSADITVSADNKLSLTEKAKYATFDAQWTAAGGTVITPGKVYECNGTDDLTFAEAVDIMARYSKRKTNNYSAMFFASTSRALLPIWIPNAVYVDFSQAFDSAAKLRKIVFKSNTENCLVKLSAKGAFRMCGNASRLEEIEGRLDVAQVSGGMNDTFPYCSNLREVRIYRLVCNISFAHSPLLSLASLQYLVENAANTKAITLTVHADVFAKLTDESNTEWHAVAVAALAKNITIASA